MSAACINYVLCVSCLSFLLFIGRGKVEIIFHASLWKSRGIMPIFSFSPDNSCIFLRLSSEPRGLETHVLKPSWFYHCFLIAFSSDTFGQLDSLLIRALLKENWHQRWQRLWSEDSLGMLWPYLLLTCFSLCQRMPIRHSAPKLLYCMATL